MSCHLLLVHGWGFGAGVWHPMLRALPGVMGHALDLGYFSRPRLAFQPEAPFVAVGHSLGFLWLIRQLQDPDLARWCRGVVSINGFTRFGVASRVLERMRRRLATEPVEVLRAFQSQAGLETPLPIPGSWDVEALAEGLSWLATWDLREVLAHWSGPVLAIAAQDDRIVLPETTRALFAPDVTRWLPDGGHVLPLTRPEACADLVGSFLS